MLHKERERGFILITSLVVLMILTIMAIGLYFRSAVNQQTSVSDRDATRAYYMAETALNYMAWAIHADPNNVAANNDANLDGNSGGDATEIRTKPDQKAAAVASSIDHVGYFDVTDSGTRVINFSDINNPPSPTLSTLAAPAHVTLNITTNATAPPGSQVSITPVWGAGTPAKDGAIVWITAGVLDEANSSNEIDLQGAPIDTSGDYAVIAYAIGYVNGTPMRMLRAKIGKVEAGFPSNLGSLTNGFQ